MQADIVFINGSVYTADPQQPGAQAVALAGEKIIYVGDQASVQPLIGETTTVYDLAGRMLMPAINDGHCHYTMTADDVCGINLQGMNTADSYVAAIRKKLNSRPDAKFLRGGGFMEATFPSVGPHKSLLDAITTEIPIAIASETYHSIWVNSKALEMANISAETPDPENGHIERNADGSPSGCLRETAQALVLDLLPDWTVAEYKESILAFQKTAHSVGMVAALDPWLDIRGRNAIAALKKLDSEGRLAMHLKGACLADPAKGMAQLPDLLANYRADSTPLDNTKPQNFTISSIKFFCDGIFETKTALMLHPYAPAAEKGDNYYGEQNWKTELMQDLFAAVDREKLQIHIHCIGDGAVRQALDAFEETQRRNGQRDARHCIAHATACSLQDLPRFKQLGVTAMLNTFWAEPDKTYLMVTPWIGEEVMEHYFYPVKSFFEAGALVANASDYPVTAWPNAFIGMETGVTRLPPDNYHPWVFNYDDPVHHKVPWPEERATVEQMIAACTINQAKANFMEEITGSITAGKYADIVVLDRNLLSVAPTDIGAVKVEQTWFKGRCVFCGTEIPTVPYPNI